MPRNPANDFDRGRRIGKYELLTRLSIGGMAELFLAFLPGPGGFKKFVALKQILPDVKADESFVRMFLDEARITAAFNHANIGQVFDLGEDPSSHELYLAMEFIAGQNLEQIIRRASKLEVPIPVGFAARVVHDACLGLHYAHSFKDPTGQSMAVVHRDVSPKNVMVTYTGQVKMIDFGIAKARGRLNRTQVGVVRGTSGYMAPEQVRNEALDGRTDLFAAGVMLHELLSGERLFAAPTDAAMMIKIADEPAKDPSAVNPWVSASLAGVVLKMLEKGREQRFANGREIARAIEQSCDSLFEEEQVAELMAQLFDDKITLTRSLLEVANEGRDDVGMNEAVKGLTRPEGEREKRPANSASRPPRASASNQRLPKVATGTQLRSRSRSGRGLPRVTPPPPPADDDAAPPLPSARRSPSAAKLKPVPVPDEARETLSDATPPTRAPGVGGLLAVLGVLVALAGLGWAVGFGPLKDQAQQWLAASAERPADNSPRPIDSAAPRGGPKPAWLLEKESAEQVVADERARQEDSEAAANAPERRKLLEEIQAQLQQLNTLEVEQRKLQLAARDGKATGEANTKKIEDLQQQIEDLKQAVALKQKSAPKRALSPDSDTVQVVRDSAAAKHAEIGYLTLRSFNPNSSAVSLEDGTVLGSTPLVKVPLDVGVHTLHVIDGESKVRILSVSIEAGRELKLPAVDIGSLPSAQ